MRKLLWLAIVLLLIAVATYYVMVELPGAVDGSSGTSAGEPAHGAATASEIERPAEATLSHIAYVHDGDTLYLQPDGTTSRADEITVRLIGIDTPELRPEVECYALEARDRLRELLPQGAEVWIMADREKLDQYGRSLLYLWTTDGTSVNLDLVREGYATALNIAPSNTYWRQFDAAETEAMDARLGMWGTCP
jgi:endonuclease YncB( thermonuclease family)